MLVRARVLALLVAVAASVPAVSQGRVHIIREIEWWNRGVWLKADLHTHTKFSDGGHTVDEVVAAAVQHGCEALAITDHADAGLTAATPEYMRAIRQARSTYPSLALIAGLEWNVPPGKGDEHADVLFPSSLESVETFSSFKNGFDDYHRKEESALLAREGLATLARGAGLAPVVFMNHPSRHPASASAPRMTFADLHRAAPSILVAFEGAPGHQRREPIGAYDGDVKPLDRWDPIAAEVGGTWDQWLGSGLDVWGALANSDFHDESGDFWPCEFSRTWLYAPEPTGNGVIRAVRAGSFFAEHGGIVSKLQLRAQIAGLSRPLIVGESATAPVGTEVVVSMELVSSPRDYLGRISQVDVVELIAIVGNHSRLLYSGRPGVERAFVVSTTVPAEGAVFRARGRHQLPDGNALQFYSNSIRVSTTTPSSR